MLIPVLLFCAGLVCLIKGGDWFVDGATGIARRFHVPELLIGVTVMLVCGTSMSLAPFHIPQSAVITGMNSSLVFEIPVMLSVMLLLTLPALLRGKLSRLQGIALLVIYAAFCGIQFTL